MSRARADELRTLALRTIAERCSGLLNVMPTTLDQDRQHLSRLSPSPPPPGEEEAEEEAEGEAEAEGVGGESAREARRRRLAIEYRMDVKRRLHRWLLLATQQE